jgi:hypothetical protein
MKIPAMNTTSAWCVVTVGARARQSGKTACIGVWVDMEVEVEMAAEIRRDTGSIAICALMEAHIGG